MTKYLCPFYRGVYLIEGAAVRLVIVWILSLNLNVKEKKKGKNLRLGTPRHLNW